MRGKGWKGQPSTQYNACVISDFSKTFDYPRVGFCYDITEVALRQKLRLG